MQIRVRKRFTELQAMDKADAGGGTPWYVINAAQSMEKVQEDIQQVVQDTLCNVANGAPLRKLWLEGELYEVPEPADNENES